MQRLKKRPYMCQNVGAMVQQQSVPVSLETTLGEDSRSQFQWRRLARTHPFCEWPCIHRNDFDRPGRRGDKNLDHVPANFATLPKSPATD
jgi:hypothetical protein